MDSEDEDEGRLRLTPMPEDTGNGMQYRESDASGPWGAPAPLILPPLLNDGVQDEQLAHPGSPSSTPTVSDAQPSTSLQRRHHNPRGQLYSGRLPIEDARFWEIENSRAEQHPADTLSWADIYYGAAADNAPPVPPPQPQLAQPQPPHNGFFYFRNHPYPERDAASPAPAAAADPTATPPAAGASGLGVGATIGIATGAIVLLFGAAAVFLVLRRRRVPAHAHAPGKPANPDGNPNKPVAAPTKPAAGGAPHDPSTWRITVTESRPPDRGSVRRSNSSKRATESPKPIGTMRSVVSMESMRGPLESPGLETIEGDAPETSRRFKNQREALAEGLRKLDPALADRFLVETLKRPVEQAEAPPATVTTLDSLEPPTAPSAVPGWRQSPVLSAAKWAPRGQSLEEHTADEPPRPVTPTEPPYAPWNLPGTTPNGIGRASGDPQFARAPESVAAPHAYFGRQVTPPGTLQMQEMPEMADTRSQASAQSFGMPILLPTRVVQDAANAPQEVPVSTAYAGLSRVPPPAPLLPARAVPDVTNVPQESPVGTACAGIRVPPPRRTLASPETTIPIITPVSRSGSPEDGIPPMSVRGVPGTGVAGQPTGAFEDMMRGLGRGPPAAPRTPAIATAFPNGGITASSKPPSARASPEDPVPPSQVDNGTAVPFVKPPRVSPVAPARRASVNQYGPTTPTSNSSSPVWPGASAEALGSLTDMTAVTAPTTPVQSVAGSRAFPVFLPPPPLREQEPPSPSPSRMSHDSLQAPPRMLRSRSRDADGQQRDGEERARAVRVSMSHEDLRTRSRSSDPRWSEERLDGVDPRTGHACGGDSAARIPGSSETSMGSVSTSAMQTAPSSPPQSFGDTIGRSMGKFAKHVKNRASWSNLQMGSSGEMRQEEGGEAGVEAGGTMRNLKKKLHQVSMGMHAKFEWTE
ncbi:hypothetical protein HDU96_005346 [Phlyctochytrium bullatum]|nr:hypothetical protein HDU96_005346 [Phlyctochytrium bullatum]